MNSAANTAQLYAARYTYTNPKHSAYTMADGDPKTFRASDHWGRPRRRVGRRIVDAVRTELGREEDGDLHWREADVLRVDVERVGFCTRRAERAPARGDAAARRRASPPLPMRQVPPLVLAALELRRVGRRRRQRCQQRCA